VLLAVAALGLGHATSIAPQLSLVARLAAEERERLGETTVLAIFRLAERCGNIAGPLVMAALVGSLGPTDAIATLGFAVAAAALAYALVSPLWRRPSAVPQGAAP
jgi:predicted MFS family arabinose efflux permease